jgi:hypothetical protein
LLFLVLLFQAGTVSLVATVIWTLVYLSMMLATKGNISAILVVPSVVALAVVAATTRHTQNTARLPLLVHRQGQPSPVSPGPPATLFPPEETCVICLEKPPDRRLRPCGHKCVCEVCYRQYQESTCPVCRAKIACSYTEVAPQPKTKFEPEVECVFCIDAPPTLRFSPCGHAILCATCYDAEAPRRCFVCDTPIQGTSPLAE